MNSPVSTTPRLEDYPLRLSDNVRFADLDVNGHMNNGRYLTLMDLGRLDIVVRSGLWRAVLKNGWTPVASTVTIRFSRELPPFQSFRLETRIACWDDKLVVMEQTFLIDGGARDGQIAARALFKGGIYDRKALAFVPMARLMETIGVSGESPLPSAEIEAFLRADAEIEAFGAGRVLAQHMMLAAHHPIVGNAHDQRQPRREPVRQRLGGAGQFQRRPPHHDQVERAVVMIGHEQAVEREQACQQCAEPEDGRSQSRQQRQVRADRERHQHGDGEEEQHANQCAAADT